MKREKHDDDDDIKNWLSNYKLRIGYFTQCVSDVIV